MAELQHPAIAQVPLTDAVYGGFWRRVVAWIIDWFIVSLAVSTVFLLLAAAIPGLANVVTLSMPFKLLTTERTLSSNTSDSTEPDGTTTLYDRKQSSKTLSPDNGGTSIV